MISDALLSQCARGLRKIADALAGGVTTSPGPAVLELGYMLPRVKRKDGPRPGSQEWFLQRPPPKSWQELEAEGKCHVMRKPKVDPRVPSAPGQQQLRYGGMWYYL